MTTGNASPPPHDKSVRAYWQLVRIICYSVIVPLAVAVAFAVVPQGIEMLHTLVEAPYADGESRFPDLLFFAAVSILFAHLTRFWASALLHFDYPVFPPQLLPDPLGMARAQVWIPKACASLVHTGIAVGFFRSGWSSPGTGKSWLYAMAAIYAVLAAFLALSTIRRLRKITAAPPAPARQPFSLRLRSGEDRQHTLLRVYALAMLIVTASLILLFAYGWDGIGRSFGAATIFCIGGCAWVTFLNFLRLLALRYRLPLLSGALVAALVFSLWMDNHKVHTVAATLPPERPSLREQYRTWHEQIQKQQPLPPGMPRPLFIVAAEGGGIRAAFWTAKVLCTLQDLSLAPNVGGPRPLEFAPHVFALSGVSGGSLGAAVFTAMCADDNGASTQGAENMLSRDHLAPLMAKMFFPDMLQRFLPFSWDAADRARALERSWEVTWREQINGKTNRFADPFHKLWSERPPGAPLLPNLFLNATVVETGQRLIASNVPIRNDAGARFLDAFDAANHLPEGRDFTLSSAVHLSARFTYFSPAGRISNDKRIVDGGYFENSGTVTAVEILRIVNDEIAREQSPEKVIPVLILISNEPGAPDVALQAEAARLAQDYARAGFFFASIGISQSPALTTTHEMLKAMPDAFASESLAPIRALLHTRESRGSLAKAAAFYEFSPAPQLTFTRTAVQQTAAEGADYPVFPKASDLRSRFLHFRLNRSDVLLPLGWSLSGPSCLEMNRQLWQWSKSAHEKWAGEDPSARPADFNPARMVGVMQMLGNPAAAKIPFSAGNKNLIP